MRCLGAEANEGGMIPVTFPHKASKEKRYKSPHHGSKP